MYKSSKKNKKYNKIVRRIRREVDENSGYINDIDNEYIDEDDLGKY